LWSGWLGNGRVHKFAVVAEKQWPSSVKPR
jgi:hypothetical protein